MAIIHLLRSSTTGRIIKSASLPTRQIFPSAHLLPASIASPTRARIAARWYTASQDAQVKEAEASDKTKSVEQEDSKQKEIDAKNKEIIELKDKYLRSVAEFRNLQDRTKRELQAGKDFAIQKFARDLIESVDNLDLALGNVPAEKLESTAPTDGTEDPYKDLKQLHGGLKMTENVLMNTLRKHGLERFDPSEKGEKFDPNIHEATFQTPQEGKEDGTCFYTTQKGFMLNGRILRAAKVGVVKNA